MDGRPVSAEKCNKQKNRKKANNERCERKKNKMKKSRLHGEATVDEKRSKSASAVKAEPEGHHPSAGACGCASCAGD